MGADPLFLGWTVATFCFGEMIGALVFGKAYNVVERVYAIFPQQSGQIAIAPARFEAAPTISPAQAREAAALARRSMCEAHPKAADQALPRRRHA